MSKAKVIVSSILADLMARPGLKQSWENIDPDTQAKIAFAWVEIVTKELSSK